MKDIVLSIGILAFLTLLISISNLFGLIPPYVITPEKLKTLPLVVVSMGIIIASIVFFRDKQKHELESQTKADEVTFSVLKSGFDEVFETLKDLNNDRERWVRAARLLKDSLSLSEKIRNPQYLKASKLAEQSLRTKLYQLLKDKSGEALPASFFYGINNWDTPDMTTSRAAIESSIQIEAFEVTIEKNIPEKGLKKLSEKSVVAIYDFLKFPSDYHDPLNDVEVWEGHFGDAVTDYSQGARRYIEHSNKYYLVDGELIERTPSTHKSGPL